MAVHPLTVHSCLALLANRAPEPLELKSFLRDEAKIDEEGVEQYLPLLKRNKIDGAVLMRATDEKLMAWGVTAGGDRERILAAIEKRIGQGT